MSTSPRKWWFVHAQRARKLRKLGIYMQFSHTSPTGRSVYKYRRRHAKTCLGF